MIAGNPEAVDRAMELLKGVAKRVIKLNVSAPFSLCAHEAGTGSSGV